MSLFFILDEQNNSFPISEPHNFWTKMHTAIPVCYFVRKKVPVWFDERQEVPVWHTVPLRALPSRCCFISSAFKISTKQLDFLLNGN